VLLVSLDTLRADAVASMPFLSGLAKDGIAFPRTYAASNWTLPSHASLLLSQSYSEHGVPPFAAEPPFAGVELPALATTLAEALHAAGFRTFGSTEGGYLDARFGFGRGFDEYRQIPALSHVADADIDDHVRGLEAFLGKVPETQAFAFVHTYLVHDYFLNVPRFHSALAPEDAGWKSRGSVQPLFWNSDGTEPPEDFLRRLYRGATVEADAFLKRLVEGARAASPDRPWLVVITSDHGEGFNANAMVRGHGTSLDEEQLRIPWIVWSSSSRFERREPPAFATSIDIAPSLLHLLGLPVPPTFRGRADRLVAPSSAAHEPVEAAFFPVRKHKPPEVQLALVEPELAFLWISTTGSPPRNDCYRSAGSPALYRSWSPRSLSECDALSALSRGRLRRWIRGDPGAKSAAHEGDLSADVVAQLKSLGYL
jgi:arylsulfatase A-like enzyme